LSECRQEIGRIHSCCPTDQHSPARRPCAYYATTGGRPARQAANPAPDGHGCRRLTGAARQVQRVGQLAFSASMTESLEASRRRSDLRRCRASVCQRHRRGVHSCHAGSG
jgi:hypothetical protein